MNLIVAGLFIAASALLIRWLDGMCRRAPLVELTRHPGTEAAIRNYEARRDALGHGARLKERSA
jgi:hypothetical protein